MEPETSLYSQGFIDSEPDNAGIRDIWIVPLFRHGQYYLDGLIVCLADYQGAPRPTSATVLSYRRLGVFRMVEPVIQTLGLGGELELVEIELV